MSNRNTIRYELWRRRKKVYIGITNDLDRRADEHANEGIRFTRIKKVGPAVTRTAALEWETEAVEAYRRHHGGKMPSARR